MLPRHERRRLDEIEQQLCHEDPEFARRLTTKGALPQFLVWLSPLRALAVAAAILALLCLFLGEGAAFFTTGALAAGLLLFNDWRIKAE